MFTPANLSKEKKTIDQLPPSAYDHLTQTRKPIDGNDFLPAIASDTQFDGERT
jgi:hypothetical protein